jgi:hypothetical protein
LPNAFGKTRQPRCRIIWQTFIHGKTTAKRNMLT